MLTTGVATFLIAMGTQGPTIEAPQTKAPKQEKVRPTPSKDAQNRAKPKLQKQLQQNRCQGSKKN